MAIDTMHFKPLFRFGVGDLFNYESRATKRLVKRTISLSRKLTKNDRVANDAITHEVWIACIVPVLSGFSHSKVAANRGVGVIQRYSQLIVEYAAHDTALDTPSVWTLSYSEQNLLIEKFVSSLREKLQRRLEEYVPEIANFLVRRNIDGAPPLRLSNLLVRNLFGNLDGVADGDLLSVISSEVAIPMIVAFENEL